MVVGTVASIDLRDDLKAEVVCRVKRGVQLPANAAPTLRETSLLGERFVALDPPAGEAASGVLPEGASLESATTHVVPDVEVVLGALSQVLNGGGLDNIETISRELSIGLSGSDVGETTRTVQRLVSTLNNRRADIVRALDRLDRLVATLHQQRTVIASALDSVPEGLRVLEDERPRLVSTLEELGKLSDTASPLLQDTKADTIADFKHLTRILENLAASKERLATALLNIGTFPFPSYTKYATKFDYAGMYGLYALDLDSFNNLLAQQAASTPAATKDAAVASPGVTPTGSPTPALPLGLKVPDITVPEVPIVSDLALPNRVVDQLVKNLSPVVGGQP